MVSWKIGDQKAGSNVDTLFISFLCFYWKFHYAASNWKSTYKFLVTGELLAIIAYDVSRRHGQFRNSKFKNIIGSSHSLGSHWMH